MYIRTGQGLQRPNQSNNEINENESRWTLDYPPFFAYFQWILAQISTLIDKNIASSINKQEITVFYQRVTVILSQIPFILILYKIIKRINFQFIIAYFSIPFILLDNIHFQYNIIMQSIFLLSIYFIQEKHFLRGAFTYACLLNFKHIYLYASIAFLAYILKYYVLKAESNSAKIQNLVKVGLVTLLPFVLSFLPFIVLGGLQQIPQIFSRLFPFQRGLIHEYWAPNFWALYHFVDKGANIILSSFAATRSITFRQISSDLHQLKILPQITPFVTTIIILTLTVPIIIKFINYRVKFNKLVFICGCLFFLFGFHVHQKAITPYISLLLVFLDDKEFKKDNQYISPAIFINIINLLPLLINSNEKLLRMFLPLVWIVIWDYNQEIYGLLQGIIFATGIIINFYNELVHPFVKSNRLQFLPLMLNSVFSATFNICWIGLLYYREIKRKQIQENEKETYQKLATAQQ